MSMCWTVCRGAWPLHFMPPVAFCIAGSHDNNLFSNFAQESLTDSCNMRILGTGHACRCGFLLFWSLVRFNCALNSLEHWQPSMGLNWIPRALSLITKFCMQCGCILLKLNCFYPNRLTLLPCFLDGFQTSLNPCGTLDGLQRRWDFKVNFVEVM